MTLTEAQKISQKKYDEKFPTLCVRLDREIYDWILTFSKDNGIASKDTVKMAIKDFKEIDRIKQENDSLKKEIEQLKLEIDTLKGKEKKGFKESLKGLFSK